ncbi:poly(ADP-ribose) polymerase and DNA-Ligase Zn-finger region domain-containing protein [Toxoplasma gondii RUB]|uniref:Poly(ADP-ribose) polymerase and DNA-Ligase Zn-finger region domain-containing protein n=4 Tax=Toxoplasma gondii TaxID=5811 RepID=A0A086LS33_TOXGO|nr:poly(ADP-ribose) polymerase and DNA-Ligase Zn-finger region domain-containing protein [Toxoplasma gondii GAB2-2007-GAL-DOM2]KFG47178.1 poly(ADP-ribose) polymerase and DNA-Ligase Zn-finger region domain-containing protein [Toxoplasma gondii FOU]KFG59451.1 poly(ADP-ribose) polymerase and DNA-Ligase Zn-finger region domain-containing protein [Toxoplasma gondii RUB]KFH03236.1 poly(ADP-ribose) polymerase and DNA-Ligase Zn-finger region domain-containing protein [Toxoplasma gondii VAND]
MSRLKLTTGFISVIRPIVSLFRCHQNSAVCTSSKMPAKEIVFHCEYAPSGRARCRVCSSSIPKGQLRLATSQPFAEPSLGDTEDVQVSKQRTIAAEAPRWCHANCFRKFKTSNQWWRTHVDDAELFVGWRELSKTDQRELRQFVEAVRNNKMPKPFSHSDPEAPTDDTFLGAERADESAKYLASQAFEKKKKTLRQSKRNEKEETDNEELPSKKKPREEAQGEHPAKASGKRPTGTHQGVEETLKAAYGKKTKGQSTRVFSPGEAVGSPKKRPSQKAKTEVGGGEGPLSPEQRHAIAVAAESASKATMSRLKEILRHNNQRMSGTKEELVQRVAEGEVMGAVPKCPECNEGFLRFDHNSGVYSCPGFMDSEGDYHRCTFKSKDVVRLPWKKY